MAKKRENYLEWDEYFMGVAFLAAQRSKDPSTQVGLQYLRISFSFSMTLKNYLIYIFSKVGACIVNKELKIVGVGYNGFPIGCSDDNLPWAKSADDRLNTKYPYVCHAELNAIINKNSSDVKGCVMYVTLFPCNECAKLTIQGGFLE
jgi:dCMP deaminase